MGYGLGVDVGTSYTVAAVLVDGRAEVAQLGGQRPELPSVVYVEAGGETFAGDAAERRGATDPARLARDIMRRAGDPQPFVLGGVPYPAPALLARLLREVVGTVGRQQAAAPSAVTVTYPAGRGPYGRELLDRAVRLAGLDNATLCPDPIAAAAHHAAAERVHLNELVAVYDLGGGNFTAAVLRKTPTGFVLAGQPEAVEQLGGVDFDEAVFRHVVAAIAGPAGPAGPGGPAGPAGPHRTGAPGGLAALGGRLDTRSPEVAAALSWLRRECVAAKEALSGDSEVLIPVRLPGLHAQIPLRRNEFEAMIGPAVAETVAALHRALHSAEVTPAELKAIRLVGGSARIPLVRQLLAAEFGRPVVLDAHPEHSVALGAALLTEPSARAPEAPPAPAVPGPPYPGAAPRPTWTPHHATRTPEPAPAPEPAPGRPPRRRRSRWLAGVAAVLAVLVLAAVATVVLSRQRGAGNDGAGDGRAGDGRAPDVTLSAQPRPTVLWSYDTGRPIAGRPAVEGDALYFGGQNSVVHAVDRRTGSVRWQYATERSVVSSPQVVDGVVYIASQDGFVYALGAESGALQWKAKAGVEINSSPAIFGDALYIGSNDNALYSFTRTGQARWRFETRGVIWGTPAVSADTVYVGSQDGNLYAVDTATGRERWAVPTGEVFSSPVLAEGALFVGSNDGRLLCLDPGTGRQLWAFGTDDKVSSSPLVAGGVAYFANFAGVVYAADARTGGERWRFVVDGGKPVFSSPALVDGVVYVGSHASRLYALDAATGVKRWDFLAGGIVGSSPRVADGVVYVGSDDGRMYALRPPAP